MGFRYRLHRKDLPGSPDLVFVSQRKVIFVHGCFWHGHNCARGNRLPKTNVDYWKTKIERNRNRDAESVRLLKKADWDVHIVWECELREMDHLRAKLLAFMTSSVENRSHN